MRHIPYKHVLRPDVQYLRQSSQLLLDSEHFARFLGIPEKALESMTSSGRLPRPLYLGLGKTRRWSVLELLEWVEAGCPRATQWLNTRGASGSFRRW